jgi:hypothetical protein
MKLSEPHDLRKLHAELAGKILRRSAVANERLKNFFSADRHIPLYSIKGG